MARNYLAACVCALLMPFVASAQINDDCANAITIACGDVVTGDTTAAGADTAPFCGTSDGTGGGLWYRLIGHGGDVTLTTCNGTSTYDTKIRVYTGGCGTLTCVAGIDDSCTGLNALLSTVTFSTTINQEYRILVHGFAGHTGIFDLSVTCAAPPNDTCAGAVSLVCGEAVYGNTVPAGPESQPVCGTGDGSAGAVWYTVVGTGGDITATTCNAVSEYDTKIRVYDGSCGSLSCVNGVDDNCFGFSGLLSTVTWASTAGTTYYILVHGFSTFAGTFQLDISCNDDCADAIPLGEGTLTASLASATNDGDTFCGASSGNPDAWYAFTAPNDGLLRVTTCGTHDTPAVDAGMDTVLSLHTGCPGDTFNEITCNDDTFSLCPGDAGVLRDSAVETTMLTGETVLIRVSHFGGALRDGEFSLNVDFLKTNDDCGNAITVNHGDTVAGDLDFASNDGDSSCGLSSGNNDLWYTFIAPCNGMLVVDTNNLGGFPAADTVLSLHSGCPGDTSNQLACDDDSGTGLDSLITWPMVAGEQVYIRVTHFGAAINDGTFLLNVSFTAPFDECPTAQPVSEGVFVGDMGCNTGTTGDDDSCGFLNTLDRWFAYTASATGTARITTCGPALEFDTVLSVFDSCGGTQLACNDDTPGAPPACQLSGLNRGSTIDLPVTAGTTYYVRLSVFNDDFSGSGGFGTNYRLSISLLTPACPNDPTGTFCDTDVAPPPAGDCIVNNQDLGVLLAAYLTVIGDPGFNPAVDFNNDNAVNNIDLGELLADYLNDCN